MKATSYHKEVEIKDLSLLTKGLLIFLLFNIIMCIFLVFYDMKYIPMFLGIFFINITLIVRSMTDVLKQVTYILMSIGIFILIGYILYINSQTLFIYYFDFWLLSLFPIIGIGLIINGINCKRKNVEDTMNTFNFGIIWLVLTILIYIFMYFIITRVAGLSISDVLFDFPALFYQ